MKVGCAFLWNMEKLRSFTKMHAHTKFIGHYDWFKLYIVYLISLHTFEVLYVYADPWIILL